MCWQTIIASKFNVVFGATNVRSARSRNDPASVDGLKIERFAPELGDGQRVRVRVFSSDFCFVFFIFASPRVVCTRRDPPPPPPPSQNRENRRSAIAKYGKSMKIRRGAHARRLRRTDATRCIRGRSRETYGKIINYYYTVKKSETTRDARVSRSRRRLGKSNKHALNALKIRLFRQRFLGGENVLDNLTRRRNPLGSCVACQPERVVECGPRIERGNRCVSKIENPSANFTNFDACEKTK